MTNFGRVPPHSEDAENALITRALHSEGAAAVRACEGIVRPEDFYAAAHRAVWEACLAVDKRGHDVGLQTVRDELVRVGKLAFIGDEKLLSFDRYAATEATETFAEIIRDKAHHRAMIQAHHELASLGYDQSLETSEYIQRSEATIFALARDSAGGEIETVHQGLVAFWTHVQKCAAAGGILGVSSGIPSLDKAIDGLWDEDLTIVAGRPSMGKTALGETLTLNIASAIAKSKAKDETVLFFSAEMGHSVLWPRMLAKLARVDSRKIRKMHGISPVEHAAIMSAVEEMNTMPLSVDVTASIGISQLRSKARKLATKKRIRAVIVDYLQLLRPAERRERRDLEVGDIAQALKELAKELKCPVVALAQVNRGSVNRSDRRPMMSDIAESGKIEAHADTILLIHRESYYRQEAIKAGQHVPSAADMPDDPNAADIIIAKSRSGITGSVAAHYQPEFCEFADREHSWP